MKPRLPYLVALSMLVFGVFLATTGMVEASILSVSATAPTVDGADIANLGGTIIDSGTDADLYSAWWYDYRPAQGQTFATGSNPGGYTLNAFTLQAQAREDQLTFPNVPFNVYVSSVSGATATQIAFDASNAVNIPPLGFVTSAFATPIHLNANSVYAVDWEGLWAGALPEGNSGRGINLTQTDDVYSGGSAYSRWEHATTGGTPSHAADPTTLVFRSGRDQVFHLDMTAIPEPSTCMMLLGSILGLVAYAWRKRR